MNSGTPFLAASSAALESGSPSVVWPSVRSTIAEGGAPRSSVRTCRVPSPSRDWLPVASIAAQLRHRLWNVARDDPPRPASRAELDTR